MNHLKITKRIGAFILLCVCSIGAYATDYVFNATNAKTSVVSGTTWNFYFDASGVAQSSADGI